MYQHFSDEKSALSVGMCGVFVWLMFLLCPLHSKNGGRAFSLPLSVCICFRLLTLNGMEYIHETSQMAKSYQDNVSQTRKTTLANLVPGP